MSKSCHRPEWTEETKDCYCDLFSYDTMNKHWEAICADCPWFIDDDEYRIDPYDIGAADFRQAKHLS